MSEKNEPQDIAMLREMVAAWSARVPKLSMRSLRAAYHFLVDRMRCRRGQAMTHSEQWSAALAVLEPEASRAYCESVNEQPPSDVTLATARDLLAKMRDAGARPPDAVTTCYCQHADIAWAVDVDVDIDVHIDVLETAIDAYEWNGVELRKVDPLDTTLGIYRRADG